ncbi:MAG: malonic semialdehyde reductase [Actinobacteria bacterium]|nr:malonic semialdehyde reductase [Actinomycetota bacterium]
MTTTIQSELILDEAAQDLLFRAARTANTFADESVTDEQLRAIYDLVKYAPTSMNTQPLRLLAVRSAAARERLVRHMSEGNKAKTLAAPLTVILAADGDFHDELPRVFPHYAGARDVFAADEQARHATARFNGALQVGYFLLGVRAAGLAAGPMTGFDADGINAEFFAGTPHRVLAVVNIGKPGENAWFDRLPRLDYDEVSDTI